MTKGSLSIRYYQANHGARLTTALFIVVMGLNRLAHGQTVHSADVASHLQKGEADMRAKLLSEARSEYQIALSLDPGNVEASLKLGALAMMSGDCGQAEPLLRGALRESPSLPTAEGLLGICEKRGGQRSARSLLESGFAGITDPTLLTEVGVELAAYYYDRNDLDDTVPILRKLISINPENTDLLFFAQHVYQDMADETLNKLALLAPESARMEEAVAEHLVNNGDLNGAIAHYRKALALDSYLPGADYELSQAMLESAERDPNAQAAARAELQKALEIDGDSAGIECEMARIFELQGRNEEALGRYKHANEMNPQDVDALMGLARLLIQQQQFAQAVVDLKQVLDVEPLNTSARYRLAMALKALHETKEAEEQLRLFQEVRKNQDKVRQIYRQMNKRSSIEDSDIAAANP